MLAAMFVRIEPHPPAKVAQFALRQLFDPAFPLIWPAVVAAWVSPTALAMRLLHTIRRAEI